MEEADIIKQCKVIYGPSFNKVYAAFQSIEQYMRNPEICLEKLLYGERNVLGKARKKTALIGIQREKVGEALAEKLNEIAE